MDLTTSQILIAVLQIIWIDLLLSGDNAVVIAMACRSLPEKQRRLGILLGAGAAVGLRIVFAVIVSYILAVPFLKIIGGLLLIWIALKLVSSDEAETHEVEASSSLWKAVRTITIADAVMSFDNVVAIVGASHGNNWLFVFGLLLSIPLIIFGSTLIMTLIERFPIFVWAGAALLGWIAGEMILADPIVLRTLAERAPSLVQPFPGDPTSLGLKAVPLLHYASAVVGAAVVVLIGLMLSRRAKRELASS
jgi:YjbE family integral membrane protein